jgi:hypothetical protein
VISIEIADIGSMMHPVMRGGVEDEFNPSWKLVKGFGV